MPLTKIKNGNKEIYIDILKVSYIGSIFKIMRDISFNIVVDSQKINISNSDENQIKEVRQKILDLVEKNQ